MPPAAVCPSVVDYQKLLSGESPPALVADLAEHLETCERCAATIHSLLNEDSLSDSVRDSGAAPSLNHLPPELVSKLLSLSESAVPMTSAAGDTQATTDGTAARVACRDDTVFAPQAMSAPQSPGEIGRLGGYRVLEALGQGGMGIVYLAEDIQLQRRVALKVMKPELARNDGARKRFLAEARAAAKVKSDHVVTIYQTGEDGGTAFAAMELLSGDALDGWLKTHRDAPLTELVRVSRETALGLAAAHEQGLIHRDIKPGNIWVEDSGRVKILDFGLARSVEGDVHLTKTGSVVGTPAFMAPEQARGEKVDHRADLFSLGCVMHRLMTGEMPFKGDTVMSVLTALAVDNPEPAHELNPSVPRRLSDLITRLLAKKPADRPQTARAAADEMKAILAEMTATSSPSTIVYVPMAEPVHVVQPSHFDFEAEAEPAPAPRPATPRPAAPRPSRRPLVFAGVAAMLLVVGAVAASQFVFATKDGTLVVEVDDDADVRFKKGKLELYDENGKLRYTIEASEKNKTLPPGKYLVKVVGADGVKVETDTFEMERKGKAFVRVTAAGPVLAKKDSPGKEPKKDVPFVPPAGAWQPTPEQLGFIEAVALLPADKRVEVVVRKLRDLNIPHREVDVVPVLEPKDGPPTKCTLKEGHVRFIWPLAALPTITNVELTGTGVTDFAPLSRLPLTELKADVVLDNAAANQAVRAISTLKLMNGEPPAEYHARRDRIRKEIDALAPKGKFLPDADAAVWLNTKLRELNPGFNGKVEVGEGPAGGSVALITLKDGGRYVGFRFPAATFDLTPLLALDVQSLDVRGVRLHDLTPVVKLKLRMLGLTRVPVTSLAPFADMPITSLSLYEVPITTLEPIAKWRLESFSVVKCRIPDVTPLKDMPLTTLDLQDGVNDLGPVLDKKLKTFHTGNRLPDLGVLKGMPLEDLSIPLRSYYYEPEEKLLKSLPLKMLYGQPVADFWTKVAEKRKSDQAFVEAVAKLPKDKVKEALQAELNRKVQGIQSQVMVVFDDADAVVEVTLDKVTNDPNLLVPLRAFPKLRKLTILPDHFNDFTDIVPIKHLPLEELTFGYLHRLNAPVLNQMPKLKTINGKPAKDVLDAVK